MTELRRLETEHKKDPNPTTLTKLTAARNLLKTLTQADTAKVLMWLKQKYYEKGNKADTMLARRLKKRTEAKRITSIRTNNGTLTDCPASIGKIFQDYYTDLYNHDHRSQDTRPTLSARIETFLKDATPKRPKRY
ncbi:Hypothetical predicted protein [Pelobates cultripes]|uniref:Uncharacterized protein n=1 Tax=Pelobates cultripes TaxID=61616 RepID=A0AAD1RET8_PELCU|nr:Hypothetical predicted protein [Pelobates cultripes]